MPDPRATTVHGCIGSRRLAYASHPCHDERQPARPSSRPAPTRAIARQFEADLSAPVLAAGNRLPNVRQISERVAMGRALWRELVIGFAGQLGELRLGFTQLAALYVLADGSTLTVGELAEAIGRSPSATSRLVDGLVRRRLVERHQEPEDRRQRTLRLTQRGHAVLRVVDRARADQFLSAVRPLPTAERAIVAMGVAALATHAISRRGRLIRTTRGYGPSACIRTRRRTTAMDFGRISELALRIQHRHTDGTWGDARAELGSTTTRPTTIPSGSWATGTIYLCKTCDEEVAGRARLAERSDASPRDADRRRAQPQKRRTTS